MKNLSIAAGHDLQPRGGALLDYTPYKGPKGTWHEIEVIDGKRKCKHCYAHEDWPVIADPCTVGQYNARRKYRD